MVFTMRLFLVIELISLTGFAMANGKLTSRQTQIAVLKSIEKVGLLTSVNDATAFMDQLTAGISITRNRVVVGHSILSVVGHRILLVSFAQAARVKLDADKDLSPLEALRQQKDALLPSAGQFISLWRSTVSMAAIDTLVDLLENEDDVDKFLALSADL